MLMLACLLVAITPESQLVIEAGKDVGSIKTGTMDPTLQKYAEEHAQRMARANRGGHHNWDQRFHELENKLPEYYDFKEVAAESWPWQNDKESAPEMFKCWRQSPGHWQTVNSRCAIWGYSMARGRNGIYYGCGIVAQRKR